MSKLALVILLLLTSLLIAIISNARARPATKQPTATATPGSLSAYRTLARQDARAVGIDPELFLRQIDQESGFNPRALSPAGAEGIAQFMPATAAALNIDPWDPAQALQAAAHLMASYLQAYGSWPAALAAYNCGPGCLRAALASGPSWGCALPAETRTYILRITDVHVC